MFPEISWQTNRQTYRHTHTILRSRSRKRRNNSKNNNNKAIVGIRLRLHCAIPPPPSKPIGCIACTQKFSQCYLHLPGILSDPFCCMASLAIEWAVCRESVRDAAAMTAAKVANAFNGAEHPQNCPFPLGYRHPAEGGPSHGDRQHAQVVW